VQEVILLIVLGTTIWIGVDAHQRDFSDSQFASKTWHWVVGSLLLWIVVFPVYLAKRSSAPLKS
jgi:cytochrome b561